MWTLFIVHGRWEVKGYPYCDSDREVARKCSKEIEIVQVQQWPVGTVCVQSNGCREVGVGPGQRGPPPKQTVAQAVGRFRQEADVGKWV